MNCSTVRPSTEPLNVLQRVLKVPIWTLTVNWMWNQPKKDLDYWLCSGFRLYGHFQPFWATDGGLWEALLRLTVFCWSKYSNPNIPIWTDTPRFMHCLGNKLNKKRYHLWIWFNFVQFITLSLYGLSFCHFWPPRCLKPGRRSSYAH